MIAERKRLEKRLRDLEREIRNMKRRLSETGEPTNIEKHPELHRRMDEIVAEHARIQQKLQKEDR